MHWAVRIQYKKNGVMGQYQQEFKLLTLQRVLEEVSELIEKEFGNATIIGVRMVYIHG